MNATREDLPELDLTPFESALRQLQTAIDAWGQEPQNTFIRDAVIQRFEFTYELSIKMLRRYLRSISATDGEINALSFRDLLRRAGDAKLLQEDVLVWLDFRQARTETVHTYNEMRAIEVAGAAKDFAAEAKALLVKLQERIQS